MNKRTHERWCRLIGYTSWLTAGIAGLLFSNPAAVTIGLVFGISFFVFAAILNRQQKEDAERRMLDDAARAYTEARMLRHGSERHNKMLECRLANGVESDEDTLFDFEREEYESMLRTMEKNV